MACVGLGRSEGGGPRLRALGAPGGSGLRCGKMLERLWEQRQPGALGTRLQRHRCTRLRDSRCGHGSQAAFQPCELALLEMHLGVGVGAGKIRGWSRGRGGSTR